MIYAVIHSRHRGVTILFTDILCEQVVSFSLFTALHFLHQIHIAQSRMLSTDTRCSQNLRQLDRSTITKYSRKPLFQFLMNDSGGEWQTIRFIQRGRYVCIAHNVFYGIGATLFACVWFIPNHWAARPSIQVWKLLSHIVVSDTRFAKGFNRFVPSHVGSSFI